MEKKIIRVYLDNCCFNRPYDDQNNLTIEIETKAKLYIQKQIEIGTIDLAWSYMLEYENGKNPYPERKESIKLWKNKAKNYVDENEDVIALAEEISATGVKSSDALHVAAAIISGCDYFITTDKRILKYRTNRIKLMNPVDVINDWSDGYAE
jgi:predicted nucleic acid-binding protein